MTGHVVLGEPVVIVTADDCDLLLEGCRLLASVLPASSPVRARAAALAVSAERVLGAAVAFPGGTADPLPPVAITPGVPSSWVTTRCVSETLGVTHRQARNLACRWAAEGAAVRTAEGWRVDPARVAALGRSES